MPAEINAALKTVIVQTTRTLMPSPKVESLTLAIRNGIKPRHWLESDEWNHQCAVCIEDFGLRLSLYRVLFRYITAVLGSNRTHHGHPRLSSVVPTQRGTSNELDTLLLLLGQHETKCRPIVRVLTVNAAVACRGVAVMLP